MATKTLYVYQKAPSTALLRGIDPNTTCWLQADVMMVSPIDWIYSDKRQHKAKAKQSCRQTVVVAVMRGLDNAKIARALLAESEQ